MKLSVVIATRRRPGLLADTLASLRGCAPQPDEVLVVDGDEERSAEAVVAEHCGHPDAAPTRYLYSSPGLAHQRNVALGVAGGEVVVFVDDDVDLAPDVFARLAEAFAEPEVVGATCRVLEPEGRRFEGRRSRLRRAVLGRGRAGSMTRFGYPRRVSGDDDPRYVEFMQGCFMSARREAARRVGFDENLPGYGLAEDEDFSYRLSRLGRLRFLASTTVVHHNTGFRGRDQRDFNRMLVVNRAYLFRKNFRRTAIARLQFAMLILVFAAHRTVNGEWSGVRGLAEGALEAWRRAR